MSEFGYCGLGYGYFSLFGSIGVTSGILAAGRKYKKIAKDEGLPQLFKNIDLLSTASGSTWFMSSLLYSAEFADMVDRMSVAGSGETSSEFMQHWVEQEIGPSDCMQDCSLYCPFGAGIGTCYGEAKSLRQDLDWLTYVQEMLRKTAAIDANILLGSTEVPDWGKGKTWFLCHSISVPRQPRNLKENLDGAWHHLTYTATGNLPPDPLSNVESFALPTQWGAMIPAKFSVKIGSGIDAPAPAPYCEASDVSLEYVGVQGCGIFGCCLGKKIAAKISLSDGFDGLAVDMAKMPVSSCAAASSAALYTLGQQEFPNIIVPFAPFAPAPTRFSRARELLGNTVASQSSLESLAKLGVCALADGSAADDTAIACALAAGVSKIFYVTFKNCTRDDPGPWPPVDIKGMQDYVCVGCEQSCGPCGPVINATAEAMCKTSDSVFEMLNFPLDDPRYDELTRITVGKVTVQTAENKWFGVQGNRDVTIHSLEVSSPLSIGFGPNDKLDRYSKLLFAVNATLLRDENEAIVTEMLLKPIGIA